MPARWTTADIPDQTGRTLLITGANAGIGYHQARELAAKGATVLLASRDLERGRAARDRIMAIAPGARGTRRAGRQRRGDGCPGSADHRPGH